MPQEPEEAGGAPDPRRLPHPSGIRRRTRVLVCVAGLGGVPLVLALSMSIAEATVGGLWFLLLPLLAVVAWALVVIGVWSGLE